VECIAGQTCVQSDCGLHGNGVTCCIFGVSEPFSVVGVTSIYKFIASILCVEMTSTLNKEIICNSET
jgi:hypothetical protein